MDTNSKLATLRLINFQTTDDFSAKISKKYMEKFGASRQARRSSLRFVSRKAIKKVNEKAESHWKRQRAHDVANAVRKHLEQSKNMDAVRVSAKAKAGSSWTDGCEKADKSIVDLKTQLELQAHVDGCQVTALPSNAVETFRKRKATADRATLAKEAKLKKTMDGAVCTSG